MSPQISSILLSVKRLRFLFPLFFVVLSAALYGQFSPSNQSAPNARQVGQITQVVPLPNSAPTFDVSDNYKNGEDIAARLRFAPAKLYSFDRASLRDVLRYLAEDAGIPFVAMLETAPDPTGAGGTAGNPLDSLLVTFTMRASPFTVLEAIARANQIALIYEKGIWVIRPVNEHELIGRTYKLRFSPQEKVSFDAAAGGSSGSSSSSSSSGSGSSASIPNMNRQMAQNIYKTEEPHLIKEIKSMLKIRSNGTVGRVASGEASVGNFPAMPPGDGIRPEWGKMSGIASDIPEPTVTFNSDTNSIYVVATRQQHQWVEGYLSAADHPQALIAIEVKFFELTKEPSKIVGVNWAQTFQSGIGLRATNIEARPYGSISVSQNIQTDAQTGIPAQRAATKSYSVSAGAPYSAVITANDMAVTMQAFMTDRDTTLVQYPRVLTVNNREVAISNARNEPILGSSQSSNSGGEVTTTDSITYLPIGTQLNILPKTMPDGSLFMNVSVTISNRVGEKDVSGNLYPITASRVFQAALQVDSGYSLAIGGMEGYSDSFTKNGVPLLKDLPGIGALFRDSNRYQSKTHLVIFITPTVIYNRKESSGISQEPASTLPVRPNEEVPRPPAFTPEGQLVGGINALNEAIRWLEYQLRYYKQLDLEVRIDKATLAKIKGIMNTAMMIQSQIPQMAKAQPEHSAFLAETENRLEDLIDDLNKVRASANKKIIR